MAKRKSIGHKNSSSVGSKKASKRGAVAPSSVFGKKGTKTGVARGNGMGAAGAPKNMKVW